MSMFIVALILPSTALGQVGIDSKTAEARPYHEISKDLRQLMRREALAKTESDRAEAVRLLADLYLELKRDARLEDAPTLQQYKAKLWSRLTRIKKELQRQIARKKIKESDGRSDEFGVQQQANQQVDRTSEALAAQMAIVSHTLGGPAKVFAASGAGAFGGGAEAANAADLVALIQRVIQPDFWDVHGGPGSIFYYAPVHALVVRATTDVHHKIGGALGGLRAAK